MARRLRSGAERVLGRHDGPRGRAFDAHYKALAGRLGPFDRLTRSYASGVAALWIEWGDAERALAEGQRQRREGRGRRPSAGQIARLQRRAGLAWQSYDQALRRLEELSARDGHPPRVPTPAELLAGLQEDMHRGG